MDRRRMMVTVLAGGGASVTGILDGLTTSGAWSLRRLYASYVGDLVTLRRSSDDVEADFTFDSNGDLDTAAITTWLDGASAFVKTLYDQSGNDRHMSQATAGNQPALVLNILNGKPVMRFTGASKHYLTAGNGIGKLANYTTLGVIKTTNTASSQIAFGSGAALSPTAWGTGHIYRNNVDGGIGYVFGDGTNYSDGNTQKRSLRPNAFALVVKKHTAGQNAEVIHRDGQLLRITTTTTAATASTGGTAYDYALGRTGGYDGVYLTGDIAEHIILPSVIDASSQRTIESDICTCYGLQILLANQTAAATNAGAAQTIPTYDGSGQAMHPSVYDAGSGNVWPATGSPSYRYWMAFTPYPNGNDDYENPSVVGSTDGAAWEVPAGVTNPLVAMPGSGFNADAELLHAQDDKLYIYYMTSDGSTYNKCYVLSSVDGVTWSAPALLFTAAYKGFGSPGVIWDGSQYVMWYVDGVTSPYKLYRRTCATPDGVWSAAVQCVASIPSGWAKDLWHLSVVLDSGTYYAFMNLVEANTSSGTNLWLYRSNDGLTWYPDATPLLEAGGGAVWDNGQIYRATAIKTAGGFDLWYSATSSGGEWKTGKTTVAL